MVKPKYTLFQQKIIRYVLTIQATFSMSVLLFCFIQLSRPNTESDHAVLFSLLTSNIAYWFPSPMSGVTNENKLTGDDDDEFKSK